MIGDIFSLSGVTFESLVSLVQEHQYAISILTPLLTGEIILHVFGILNGSGDISLFPFAISIVSIIVFDAVMYVTIKVLRQRYDLRAKIAKVKILTKFEKIFLKCEERYSNYPVLLLFAIKLVPMTKVTILFFSLWCRMSVVRFVLQDIIVTVIWALIIFLPGWFVGKEVLSREAGRNITSFIIYFLLLVVLVTLFGKYLDELLLKATSKIGEIFDKIKRQKRDEDM